MFSELIESFSNLKSIGKDIIAYIVDQKALQSHMASKLIGKPADATQSDGNQDAETEQHADKSGK